MLRRHHAVSAGPIINTPHQVITQRNAAEDCFTGDVPNL